MARMIKANTSESREKYSYLAYPKKLDRTFQAMVLEEAGKYGIENVKDLMKNILMEAVVFYEKKHRYIESRDWAAQNWQKNRFGDTTAANVEDKLGADTSKVLASVEKDLAVKLEEIKKLRERITV